ncbi:CaiB/BaiF CoA transferase family protein [Ramlibacter albus]|uniref:CoA transferase n=1 Tax=Ramlibacter albus TaxID=2079448 RepID=A0A923S1R2_9BURK|nr:CoA transferase [Ramlibacter albus]MBC5763958.1 CoA transferase [Ramlibacter albus]
MPGPLQGLRVIDLTTVAMGPLATQTLGDMGADVIKVESPSGDHFRVVPPSHTPNMGAAFLNLNRNKRSIVLDLKAEGDMDVLLKLLDGADIFISNIRPRALRKLGLDYETLAKKHPRLIYCGAYGFSEDGPYAGRPAYDDIIQAMSGLAHLQATGNDGAPAYVNTIIADKAAALTVTYAISMALYERERSGRGQAIEVPMFETMVAFTMVEHMAGATFAPANGGMGYDRILSEHRRPYPTLDGYIALLPYTSKHWRDFFAAAGVPQHGDEPRFNSPETRARNVDALYGELARLVALRSTQEWVELLSGADIPFSKILSPQDLLDDPHLNATGFFRTSPHPTEGEVRTLGIPVKFSRTPGAITRPAPNFGEHGAQIREELGMPVGAQ